MLLEILWRSWKRRSCGNVSPGSKVSAKLYQSIFCRALFKLIRTRCVVWDHRIAQKSCCVTANSLSTIISHKSFADRKTRFYFLMPQTTDRTSYHTRCEKSEQSLRKQPKKIISSKYYDQAMLFRVTAESNPLSIHLSFFYKLRQCRGNANLEK